MSEETGFSRFVKQHRCRRHWSRAELARRAELTQPEVSRVESGARNPTLRLVIGIAEAFSHAPLGDGEPPDYPHWVSGLADLGEEAREQRRSRRPDGN